MSSVLNTTSPSLTPTYDPSRAHETNLPRILGVLTTFHFLALIFVALRVYARIFVVKNFGKDDFCMVLSALCALGGWITWVLQGYHGLGMHQWTFNPEQTQIFMQIGFWQSIVSAVFALAFLKLSIGFGLLRLSTHKIYSIALWSTMAIVVAYSIVALLSFVVHCRPMAAYWDKALQATAQCNSMDMFVKFSLVNTSFNIATDVLFATYPIPIVWMLQMKRRTKIYLVGILSLGYLAVAFGIAKAIYQIAYKSDGDKSFNQWVQFWGFQQLNFGIIAACAASLKPLFNRFLGLSSAGKSKGTGNPSTLHTWGSRSFGMQRQHERLGDAGEYNSRRGKSDLDTVMIDSSSESYEMEPKNSKEKRGSDTDILYPGTGAIVQAGRRDRGPGDDASSSEGILGTERPVVKGIVVETQFGVNRV